MNKSNNDIFADILRIGGYDGDVSAHAAELSEALEATISKKVVEATQEYFQQYFEAIVPTLSDDQRSELEQYLQNMATPTE